MSEQTTKVGFAAIGEKWRGWATVLGTVVAVLALLGVGSVIYNEVWNKKVLAYTLLPSYDLGNQAFTGVVLENRGRGPLTDVQLVLADLPSPIQVLNMPGAHEPVVLTKGGIGENEATLNMARLSEGASLSIYILTSEAVRLQEGQTFYVAAKEAAGKPSADVTSNGSSLLGSVVVVLSLVFVFGSSLQSLRSVRKVQEHAQLNVDVSSQLLSCTNTLQEAVQRNAEVAQRAVEKFGGAGGGSAQP